MKKFADDNFKFDENGRKFFTQVENTVGKGEIAPNKQFLLYPHSFQRLVLQTHENQGLFGKGLKPFVDNKQNVTVAQKNYACHWKDGKYCGKGMYNAGY